MQYMTIVLELLSERTELHEQLRQARRLLPTVEAMAEELRESHFAWMEHLEHTHPGSDPLQTASQALEVAVKELEDRLPPVFPPDGQEALSLDQAMAFIQKPTPKE